MMKGVTGAMALILGAADVAAQSTPDRAETEIPSAHHEVAGLPDSHGRSFATLDAYLAHLRAYAGTIDRPWYREVRPDVFRLETTMTGAAPKEFTRDELARRFGFER